MLREMTSEKLHWGSPKTISLVNPFINMLEQIKLIKWQEKLEDTTIRTRYPDSEPSGPSCYSLKLRI